tara:strand:+ start:422 stop:1075 length:654 start_codon:yes stop_codon:yes gene_type:complete
LKVFVQRNGEQQGPFTLEDVQQLLKEGQLLDSDLGWIEGTPEGWKRLDQLKLVKAPPPVLMAAMPVTGVPPIPPMAVPVPANASKAGMWWAIGGSATLVMLIVGLFVFQNYKSRVHKQAMQAMHEQLQGSWGTSDPEWDVSLRFEKNMLMVNYRGKRFEAPFRIDGVNEEKVTLVFPIIVGEEYLLEFNGPDFFNVEKREGTILEINFIPDGEYQRQ